MLRTRLSARLIALGALVSASANAQTLHARPGQTFALGVAEASVYYDDSGGTFRVVATLGEGPQSTPIRFTASLKLGQELTISVPGLAGKSAAEVHLTRTQQGLDVAYVRPAID